MTALVLAYYPGNPWPPRHGSHRRCLQMLDGLVQIGARVHLASPNHLGDQPWTQEGLCALRARGLERVWVYQRFRGQRRLERLGAHERQYQWLGDWVNIGSAHMSWWQRRWFRRLLLRLQPSSVVIHYAFSDGLLEHDRFPNIYRIMEMQDLLSVNVQIRSGVDQRVKQFIQTGEAGELFDTTLQWADKLTPADDELAIYDKYDAVIAISRQERLLLQQKLRHARAIWIPMHIQPVKLVNLYNGPPIFLASGNKFNQAALLLLLNEVLGRVLAECHDFQIDVVGDLSESAIPSHNVRYIGYVPNLDVVCQKASFAICPVFAGTGQQVKLIEAMAHGLAVVAFRRAAAESPLRHGENGLVAADSEEFARHVIRLWRNRDLCRQFGTAARAMLDNTDNTAMALRGLLSNLT
jgi:glycosyltransferase involved in cell wall biosynthesis